MWMVNRSGTKDKYKYSAPYKLPCRRQLSTGEKAIEITDPPSRFYYYDGEWKLDRDKWLNGVIRPARDKCLDDIDLKDCNPEKWSRMEEEEKSRWAEYKQALRDLPETIDSENPEFPEIKEVAKA